jgi:hypothetical protein
MGGLAHAPLTPSAIGELFEEFARPWWIAGGWALDLFLGRQTRAHADIEVALLRGDQAALRTHLSGWELHYVRDRRLEPWPEGRYLQLPIHEVWGRKHGQEAWQLELLLNEHVDGDWLFRRDTRIRRPLTDVGVVTENGLPALAPEIVLLYKAANPQPRDQLDFATVLPSLDERRKSWLTSALRLAYPDHAWL